MRPSHPLLIAALLLPAAPGLFAHDAAFPTPPPSSALAQDEDLEEAVQEIIDEYDDAMAAYRKLYKEAETDEARTQLRREKYPKAAEYAELLLPVVEVHPESEAALTAIIWMLQKRAAGENEAQCYATLLEFHVGSEEIGGVCSNLARETTPEAERFLRTVYMKGTVPSAKGLAAYSLASLLGSRLELRQDLADADEEMREQMDSWYETEAIAAAQAMDVEATKGEREKLLVEVQKLYADVPLGRRKLGAVAAGVLFELHKLQIGMVAPDIVGPDLDGEELKLSDYRGKVVFLDFWGDW